MAGEQSLNSFDNIFTSMNPFSESEFCTENNCEEADVSLIDLQHLDLTTDEHILDNLEECIKENLEDELVKHALESGVDLRLYSRRVKDDLSKVEDESIQDYIAEAENIAQLHGKINGCDTILARMEEMLYGFQNKLGSISEEIRSLQDQSTAMNIKLRNRQDVRGELSQFIDEMAIPQSMIQHIVTSPASERHFIEDLHELHHKLTFVKEQSFNEAVSSHDVKGDLEKLKIKAITKIREYLLSQVMKFKKPMTNYQIPQQALLKVRFFYEFLLAHDRLIAKEILDIYVEITSKMYFSYFKEYCSRLMKLQYVSLADKG